ncbi:NUDIX domain-containing protein [Methylobacterium sp. Leaf466]|uniref:NUDIX hydrolase n=1 Tax=Methylobacterium sp. Leaf466 TaxID=1736386 RepID=UPI0006F95941|nr:NUDIX domain-containing protein [Methylobacterium sp. Leaf466]KQT76846.1 NUDIX hydrolase [Methylobacterium sp. Leaf466]
MTEPPHRQIARALVFDPRERLLLIEYEAVRPFDPVDPERRGFWFMPGGGIELGETPEQACRRELAEEIGRPDVDLGPCVATCDGPFHLFRTSRIAHERYFVVRLPDDRIDTARLAETEDNPVRGVRWWSLSDLDATSERIEPRGLAALARRILDGDVPGSPVTLSWHDS